MVLLLACVTVTVMGLQIILNAGLFIMHHAYINRLSMFHIACTWKIVGVQQRLRIIEVSANKEKMSRIKGKDNAVTWYALTFINIYSKFYTDKFFSSLYHIQQGIFQYFLLFVCYAHTQTGMTLLHNCICENHQWSTVLLAIHYTNYVLFIFTWIVSWTTSIKIVLQISWAGSYYIYTRRSNTGGTYLTNNLKSKLSKYLISFIKKNTQLSYIYKANGRTLDNPIF